MSSIFTVSNENALQCNNDGVIKYVVDVYDEDRNSFVRTKDCIPQELECYQFDVEIVDGGENYQIVNNISIGLCSETSNRSPGMNQGTIGICGLDGSICRHGEAVPSGLPFTTRDIVSCVIHRSKIANNKVTINKCQFSKNGQLMGKPLNVMGTKLYPAVGLHCPGATVKIKLNITPVTLLSKFIQR